MGAKRIEKLKAAVLPIEPQDSMAEAGRKLLLVDFIKMLEKETGSRSGEDIEDVHDMRVAIRRMRSALRLLDGYFVPGVAHSWQRRLRTIGNKLGTVRDLDVMIDDLTQYLATVAETEQPALQSVIARLDKKRQNARQHLINFLDSKIYKSFVKEFNAFLKHNKQDNVYSSIGAVTPYQVRHVLSTLIYEHLSYVRAYDTILEDAEVEILHALRIEFKRLRYLVSFFAGVLGKSIESFGEELKKIQDHLGRLNDINVAHENLEAIRGWKPEQAAAVQTYLATLQAEVPQLRDAFPAMWAHFNSRTVQRKLSDAILMLR